MFERRLYFHVDWLLLGAVILLSLVGVAMIYSTTYVTTATGGHAGPQPLTQLYALGLGLLALLVCLMVDYRVLAEHSLFVYGALVVLLVFVLFKGSTQMGAQRWIPIGPFHLQPSEFGRLGVALILAMYFGENRRGARNTGDLVIGGVFMAIPLLLIAKQPDLGTAVTLLPVFFGVAYLAGLRMRLLGIIAIACLPLGLFAYKFALKDYQRQRIETFLDPSQDPRGAGYQTIQARVTVGSGGLDRQRLPPWDARGAQVPPRGPQRLHLLGPRGGAGLHRRARRAGPLPVRDFAIARGGTARQGPPRRVSGGGHHYRVCVPGALQRDDVGRPGAGEGDHAAAHELRRIVPDRIARRFRPHPECQDAGASLN